jgi:hypothetical protein
MAFAIGGVFGACISPLLTWQAFGSEDWEVVIAAAVLFALVFGALAAFVAPERTEKIVLFIVRFLNP